MNKLKFFSSALLLIFIASATLTARPKVKNVIFMIGDGMGIAAVTSVYFQNDGQPLAMQRATNGGVILTWSSSSKVTDSAAASTAMACGVKTNNGAIGVDSKKNPVESILIKASKAGMATGLVVTESITGATPAGFIAHDPSRQNAELIAESFLNSGINLFIGGGSQSFNKRKDGRDLISEMTDKGYKMTDSFSDVLSYSGNKLGALLAPSKLDKAADRGDYLPDATAKSLELLKKASRKGFFVMIEGSLIDGGGHGNDINMVVSETKDFDKAVGKAFDFADKNPGTLVIVTADHETGGLTLAAAKNDDEQHAITPGIAYGFSTKGHTATMVPLLAYGTGAEYFGGIKDNTELPKLIASLLGLQWTKN